MRHKVYRRINAGSETVVMRYRRRDKAGETRGEIEKRDRGRFKGKRQKE